MSEVAGKRRVNFGKDTALNSISEGTIGEEIGSLATDDLGMSFMRHSIQAIVSAKSASKIFKTRAVMARKNKRKDDGLIEVLFIIIRY